jgi:hypothetical protein
LVLKFAPKFASLRGVSRAALASVALAALLLAPNLASAQSIDIKPTPQLRGTTTPDDTTPQQLAAPAPIDDVDLANALNFDADQFIESQPKKSMRALNTPPAKAPPPDTNWKRDDKGNGAASVSVNRVLPVEWETKVGADLDLPPDQVTTFGPNRPLPSTGKDPRSGAAWANVAVPDVATVEVRVTPSDDQRKVGTSVQRTVPLGSVFAVTVQRDVAVTENYPGGVSAPAITAPGEIWDNSQQVRLSIKPTGTTLAAASNVSSLDNLTHHTLSAEQKIYGPLEVKTAVTDPGQPTASKSISAGLRFNW